MSLRPLRAAVVAVAALLALPALAPAQEPDPVDLGAERAHWLARDTLAWASRRRPAGASRCTPRRTRASRCRAGC